MNTTNTPGGQIPFVEETTFGLWFLQTKTWYVHVLQRALNDLQRLTGPMSSGPVILDVGCGRGRSFALLEDRFRPTRIAGLDPDFRLLQKAKKSAAACRCPVELRHADAAAMDFPDGAFDMVFCHQSFHHIVDQEQAIREFYRVLKPGGTLLFAESTKRYIHSWLIRWLFRHPMDAQKTADEYISLIRGAGFDLPSAKVSLPFLWWSREDLGIFEKLGIAPPADREETLVNAVATKPL